MRNRRIQLVDRPLIRTNALGIWQFWEKAGTTVADLSGKGGTGTLIAAEAADWVAGPVGLPALNLDAGEYVSLNSTAVSNIGGRSTGAMMCWFKCRSAANGGSLIRAFGLSDLGSGSVMTAFLVGSGSVSGAWTNESCFFNVVPSGTTGQLTAAFLGGEGYYADGTWHHMAMVVDGSANKFYIDGVAKTTAFSNGGATTAYFTNITSPSIARIGGIRTGGVDYTGNDSQIADVRVYSSITAADIAAIAAGRG